MKFLLSIIPLLIFSTSIMAKSKVYEYSLEEVIKKSRNEIKAILLDRESYCEDCLYSIENLREAIIVEKNGSNQLFIYNDVYKMGAYPNFTVMTIKEISSSVTQITVRYVDKKKASDLTNKTGYDHRQPFDRMDIDWILTKISSTKTKVCYEVLVESDNPLIKLGWSQVIDGTRAGAKHVLGIVKR